MDSKTMNMDAEIEDFDMPEQRAEPKESSNFKKMLKKQ